jgi:GMP synthase-like glutamine amidotransferase
LWTEARPRPPLKRDAVKIHCLLHSAIGGDIHLPDWAASRGHAWTESIVPEAIDLPRPENADCLVVLGGPMSAWEEGKHPWLTAEKRTIESFIDAGRPVLGICLGAQMLADIFGARTYRGAQPEVGWHRVRAAPESRVDPVASVLPDEIETFLWHADTFDIPDGALRIAGSAAFANQGFVWNLVLALQFHLEVRPDWVRRLVERDADQLVEAGFVQSSARVLGQREEVYRANNALMDRLLNRWLAGIEPARRE